MRKKTGSDTGVYVIEAKRKVATANLKRCPLCEALNAFDNAECFVCRWHGKFDHDPKSIERGLTQLLRKCPELRVGRPHVARQEREMRTDKVGLLLYRLFRDSADSECE